MTTLTTVDHEILDHFKNSSAYREAQEKLETEKHAERGEAIQQIVKLKESAETEVPRLTKARDVALKKNQKAFADLQKSQEVLNEANGALRNASTRLNAQINQLERELLSSSDLKIDELIELWNAEHDRICRRVPAMVWESPTGLYKRVSGVRELERKSNREQLDAVMEEISNAIKQFEALRLSDQTNIEDAIEKIVKGLPAMGEVNSDWGVN